MEGLFGLAIAPLLAILVSVVYFFAGPKGQQIGERLAVSVHGVTIAILFTGAMTLHMSGHSHPSYAMPFFCSLLLPLGLIVFALWRFRGPRFIHAFQLLNFISLALTFFIGGMAITGDWL